MRNGLYMFRHEQRLSQQQMADKIGCSRATYSSIETGSRDGRVGFWNKLQRAFNLPNEKMGGLMAKDKQKN